MGHVTLEWDIMGHVTLEMGHVTLEVGQNGTCCPGGGTEWDMLPWGGIEWDMLP